MSVQTSLFGGNTVARTEDELKHLILGSPLDNSLRAELEQVLSVTEPDCIDRELLQRERLIADSLDSGEPVDDLIQDYRRFCIDTANYFWDERGCLDHLFRPFSLWLIGYDPSRKFALGIALENKLQRKVDIDFLPVEFLRAKRPDSVFAIKRGIIEFVQRYRGPSGREPELAADEIKIVMLASGSQNSPGK